ncbi:MAG: TspO/MBR family protein [Candidatus Buchananbacteria bacterium]
MIALIKLLISIAATLLIGFVGSIFTTPNISGWYANLNRPVLSPPNWVFAPVWTTLFILMGLSLFLVWNLKNKSKIRNWFLIIFILNLVLNTFWSILFFDWQAPGLAFLEIIPLWLSILALIILGRKIYKPAAWLLIPYLLWVSFASYLNFSFWLLNR